MTRKPLRLLAYSSAFALAVCFHGQQAQAQTETVTATLITSSAIDSAVTTGMDFGTWLIQFAANSTPSITLTNDGSAGTSQTGVIGNSTVVEITDSANEGVVTVTTPAPTVLDLTRGTVTDFAQTVLSLSTITYDTATESSTVLAANAAQPVTVVAGNTAETVRFGGIVTITGTPTDATHTATFNITFAY